MKETLSIVIAAKNCESRIEGTIYPWKDIATEIIVVDQLSTDRTVEYAKKLGSKVISNDPPGGNFDFNRKLGIKSATSDWILYIDTDERPTKELIEEIKNFLMMSKDHLDIEGIKIPNIFYFLGKPLRHGIYNSSSAEVRMFRKNGWDYPCEEGYHRGVSVNGRVIRFKYGYKHFNVNSLSEWFIKTNQYTEFDALKNYKNRPSKKYFAYFRALQFFIKHYFFKLGFLDGLHGLTATFYFMLYHLTLELKLWEFQFKEHKDENEDYLRPLKGSSR